MVTKSTEQKKDTCTVHLSAATQQSSEGVHEEGQQERVQGGGGSLRSRTQHWTVDQGELVVLQLMLLSHFFSFFLILLEYKYLFSTFICEFLYIYTHKEYRDVCFES